MKQLVDFKYDVYRCSKCGICQGECPIYKITGNDCSVSRGHFIMLKGLLNGDLKMTKTLNHYLDLCLKCGACSKFCPSGIDVVDIIVAAKAKYFELHFFEKIKSFFLKNIIFGLLPNIALIFNSPIKSKSFEKKVLYFGGCSSKLKGDRAVVKLLNKLEVEVVNPNFSCCGVSLLMNGDLKGFEASIKNFVSVVKLQNLSEIVTTCASCEKSLKDYIKWAEGSLSDDDINLLKSLKIKNIYEYIRESNTKLVLDKKVITYHKPCNIDNYDDIEWVLNNTENLVYIKMNDFDKCCGLNGISKIGKYKILSNVFIKKRKNIKDSKAKIVLTSCLGCESALKFYSFGQYKVYDLIEFLSK